MPETDNLSLAHLEAELARIDVLIQREVRRWQLAGQDPSDTFRGLRVSDDEALGLLERPFGASWGATAELGPEQTAHEAAAAAAQQRIDEIVARAARQDIPLRLRHLVETFDLDAFDLDAFLICLAPTLDLRYERLYGYLQDDVTRRRPSVNLVLDLLCEPGPQRLLQLRRFADGAPLLAYALLERAPDAPGMAPSLLGQSLLPDEAIVAWLLGNYRPHADLGTHARLTPGGNPVHDEILAGKAWPALQPALRDTGGRPAVLVFHGPDQAGQEAAARLVAGELYRPLLRVDLTQAVSAEMPAPSVVRAALRDARLTGAIPFLLGWDACLATDMRNTPVGDIQNQVNEHPQLVIIAGGSTWQARGREQDRNLVWMEFPVPDFAHRQALWQHFIALTEAPLPDPVSTLDLVDLAGQFSLTSLQIHDAAAAAADQARLRGGALDRAELFQAARSYSSPGLANLAHKIEARYTWSDIVLPADQLSMLKELIATVRGRPMVLETWGVGEKLAASAGVTILFAGPPGTGKTMAAEVIASELGLELYKIDLSTVVNKYIGETEKNLGRIFDEASNSNAILFFDEADALFGKRSEVKDAHDRYANIEVSYLLQRMETYDGVTILATNLRANLDEAFTRRLQFAVDFPFPDEAYRLRIWQALFPDSLPRADNIDLALLAQRFKLAGGNIRNIIVSAAYLAAADGGVVTMPHLLHGARRELQKMGRLVKEKEMTLG
jgi:SpoVK/Ycf46/Vps4 family AAA+-type ATPase